MGFLSASIVPVILINCILALSQSVALRAGVFSIATTGLAAIGGYTSAALVVSHGWSAWLAGAAGVAASTIVSCLLASALVRLRDVFAAMATLAFVLVVQTILNNWTSVTGGSQGLTNIPIILGPRGLLIVLLLVILVLSALDLTSWGVLFDSVRQDEGAAVSQGISVGMTHFKALTLSGALGGLGGVCLAYNSFALFPDSFAFSLATQILTFVYLGGYRSWRGPVAGAFVVTILPELFRPLASQRLILNGAILIIVMIVMPKGIVDTLEPLVRRITSRFIPSVRRGTVEVDR